MNKKIILFIIIIIVVFGGIGTGAYFLTKDNKPTNTIVKKASNEIDGYGYTIDNLDTKLYKEEYNLLKENLSSKKIDMEKYASSIAKLFIIDLYTINNKLNKYDVGGLEFLKEEHQENYITNVMDTLYKYVEDNSEGKRNQELPEVSSITVESVKESKFIIKDENDKKGKEYPAYKVNLTWEYTKDLGYDSKAEVIIINDNNKLYVVEKN